jgi:hypothetical protein
VATSGNKELVMIRKKRTEAYNKAVVNYRQKKEKRDWFKWLRLSKAKRGKGNG